MMQAPTRPGSAAGFEEAGARRTRRGWLVVVGIMVVLAVGAGLGFYGLSVYLSTLNRVKGFSVSGMSGATATFFIVSGAAGLLISRLLRSVDPRPIIVAGALCSAVALVLLGRVTALWQVYLVYVVFAFGNAANSLVVSTTVVARWFHERRAVALSVASTGLSLGGMLLTPLIRQWLKELPLTTATNRLAVIYLVVVVPVTLVLVRPDPAAFGLGPDGRVLGGAAPVSEPGAPAVVLPSGVSYADAIRSRTFLAITLGFLFALGAQVGAIAQLVKLSDERITSAGAAGRTVSILAGCSVVGRLLGGVVADRLGIERFTIAVLAMQASSLVLLSRVEGVAPMYVGAAAFGVAVGNVLLLHPLLLAHVFGMSDYPRIYGRSQFFTTFGVAGGPFLYGWLHDHAGGYSTSYLVGGALGVTGLLLYRWGGRSTLRREPEPAPTPGGGPAGS